MNHNGTFFQIFIVLNFLYLIHCDYYVGVEIYSSTSACNTEYYGIEAWIADTCIRTTNQEWFQFSSSNNTITLLNCTDSECSNCTSTIMVQGTCTSGVHDNVITTDKWMTWYDEPTFYIGPSFTVSFYDSESKPCSGDPVGYTTYSSYTCNGGLYYECTDGSLAIYQCEDIINCNYQCYQDNIFETDACFLGVTNPYLSYSIDCSKAPLLSFNWITLFAIMCVLCN